MLELAPADSSLPPARAPVLEAREPLWLHPAAGFSASWHGVVSLLDQLCDRLGADRVGQVLREHKPAASLLFPALAESLDADERSRREQMSARWDSHLTHNHAIQAPLFDAWGELLDDLLAGDDAPAEIVVPTFHLMDLESLQALRAMVRQRPEGGPDLLLGQDPADAPDPDARGLISRPTRHALEHCLNSFLTLPSAQRRPTAAALSSRFVAATEPWVSVTQKLGRDRIGEDAEPTALAALAGDPPAALAELLLAGMAAAFRRFGFMSTVHLGAKFLDLCATAAPAQQVEALELLGISAHNVQFLRGDNAHLGAFLEPLYRRVLADEQRPARRLVIYYRLAVTLGRRQHRFDEAFEWVERLLAEAPAMELGEFDRAYQSAWALNFRAYLWNWRKRTEECRDDCVRGHEELARLEDVPVDRHIDRRFVMTAMAQNAAGMSFSLKRYPDWERWLHVSGALEPEEPWAPRFRSRAWIRFYTDQYRLDAALAYAWDGLANATSALDGTARFRFLVESGSLCYRLAHLDQATRALQEARGLRQKLLRPDELPAVELPLALAHLRAGRLASAAALLEPCLDQPARLPTARTLPLCLLALTAAHAGDEQQARARIDEALALCARQKERELLVRTLAWAGHAFATLHREDEAIRAFSTLLRATPADAGPTCAGPRFIALVKLAQLEPGKLDGETARRMVELIPAAFQEAEPWWELPLALDLVRDGVARGLLDLEAPEIRRSLAIFTTLASQRRGVGLRLRALTALLPEALAAPAMPLWPDDRAPSAPVAEFNDV